MPIPAIMAAIGAALGEGAAAGAAGRAAAGASRAAAAGGKASAAARNATNEEVLSSIIESQKDAKQSGNENVNKEEIDRLKGLTKNNEQEEEKTGWLKKAIKGLNDFDDSLERAAQVSQEMADMTVNAVHNRFIPLIKDILPKHLSMLVDSVTRVVNSFVDRGKELAGLSAELAYANAIVDVRGVMADMKEAQALGPDMARLTLSTDQIWIELRDILLPIKESILYRLTDLVEMGADILKFIADHGLEQVLTLLAKIADTTWDIIKFSSPMWQILDVARDIAKNTDKDGGMTKEFMDMLNNAKKLKFEDEGFREKKRDPHPQPMNLGLFAGL